MSFPDNVTPIFIVGAGRAGTTTILEIISKSELVCKCKYKEPCFFDRNYHFGLNWYKSLYNLNKKHRYSIEASTDTMWYPDAFKRIKINFPDAKIIYSLRNPGARSFASYLRMIDKSGEDREFYDIFDNTNLLKKRSEYPKSLKNCYKYFKKEDVLILIFERWINDPSYLSLQINKFLNLKNTLIINKIPKSNSSRIAPVSISLQKFRQKFLLNNYKNNILLFYSKAILRKVLEYVNHIPIKNFPKITNSQKRYLYEYYLSDISQLESMIEQNLSEWKDWYLKSND